MKISIKDEGKRFFIPLPTSLIFSSFSLWILKHSRSDVRGIDLNKLSPEAMRNIRRTIRRMRRIHKDFYLVEVEDGDSTVRIKL